jgi:hypothetical protein
MTVAVLALVSSWTVTGVALLITLWLYLLSKGEGGPNNLKDGLIVVFLWPVVLYAIVSVRNEERR